MRIPPTEVINAPQEAIDGLNTTNKLLLADIIELKAQIGRLRTEISTSRPKFQRLGV